MTYISMALMTLVMRNMLAILMMLLRNMLMILMLFHLDIPNSAFSLDGGGLGGPGDKGRYPLRSIHFLLLVIEVY